jgi:F0F1-type ATP synthase membrane subunit c/vacuolar-type H+-ATPase subunit K
LQQYGDSHGYRFLYGPFLAGCVTITAQSAWDQVLRDSKLEHSTKLIGLIATSCLACAVVVLPTFLLQSEVSVVAPICVAIAVLAVGIPSGILFEHQVLADSDRWWWIARMFSIMVVMGLLALVQAIGVIPVWNPR